jgi:hypothetical protein
MFCRQLGLGRTEGQGLTRRAKLLCWLRVDAQINYLTCNLCPTCGQPQPRQQSRGVTLVKFHHCNFDIEEHDIEVSSISKLKTTISVYTNIEGAFFDIDKSSISGHYDIEVKNFDIEDSSISYCFDIEQFELRYRSFWKFRPSISKSQNFDIEV